MQYRTLGKTDIQASVVGLGTEHLDNKPYEAADEVIGASLEHGINILDLFMPGTPVRENIGKALKERRRDVIIQGHIGSTDLNQQYDMSRDPAICEKFFNELLRCLNTDDIDIGMMFFIDSEKDFKEAFESDYLDYVLRLKQKGKIRMTGASSHHPEIAAKVVETGIVEHLMFSVNLAYDMLPANVYIINMLMADQTPDQKSFKGIDKKRAGLYELCAAKGVSITTMKTLGAGKLIDPNHTPFAKPFTVPQCIRYALSRPGVVSTLIGCKNRAEVLEAVSYLDKTEAELDYSDAVSTFRDTFSGKCVYCNHCLPCPSGIDIAAVTKYLEIAALDEKNVPPSVRQHYDTLSHKASECIECGSCESRCPFNVNVIENMKKAVTIFGA
jgi:predicted aldo/keto reductase-like oxidoreductase